MADGLQDFYRGDSKKYTIRLPSDMVGHTIWFTMKGNMDDLDDAAAIQKSDIAIIDPDDGTKALAEIILSPDDTNGLEVKRYSYDFQIVSPDKTYVETFLADHVKVLADVTRSY